MKSERSKAGAQRREPEEIGGIATDENSIAVPVEGPFNLSLSLEAAASFFPPAGPLPASLLSPVFADGAPVAIKVWQPSLHSSLVHASASPPLTEKRLRELASWLIFSDLDLRPFYKLAASHAILGPVAASLEGLKPLRPPSLFEMAIVAITEQQLSLAAAFHIRSRLLQRFGTEIGGLRAFPRAEKFAAATLEELCACGLSLAQRLADGILDLEALKSERETAIREALLKNRGFGEWSVEYILARGFGRLDCLPAADTSLRSVAGQYFAAGRKLTISELEEALAPFKPYRSLAAYYLAVHWRLQRKRRNNGGLANPSGLGV